MKLNDFIFHVIVLLYQANVAFYPLWDGKCGDAPWLGLKVGWLIQFRAVETGGE